MREENARGSVFAPCNITTRLACCTRRLSGIHGKSKGRSKEAEETFGRGRLVQSIADLQPHSICRPYTKVVLRRAYLAAIVTNSD